MSINCGTRLSCLNSAFADACTEMMQVSVLVLPSVAKASDLSQSEQTASNLCMMIFTLVFVCTSSDDRDLTPSLP